MSGLADGRQSRSAAAKRDRVRREIFDTLPVERIGAATGLMMRWQLTDPPSNVGVARFIASLNLRELQELRRLAQQTRADGAVNWPAARPYAGDDVMALAMPEQMVAALERQIDVLPTACYRANPSRR